MLMLLAIPHRRTAPLRQFSSAYTRVFDASCWYQGELLFLQTFGMVEKGSEKHRHKKSLSVMTTKSDLHGSKI